ncbi:MAG: CAP domain-containing protein [Chloroflexi bacterium]|nr:CAP domain-containing protein [Chloroflexota bacterium]MYD48925.1 CAP domain-containing protein [Chloroflexota bacterium]
MPNGRNPAHEPTPRPRRHHRHRRHRRGWRRPRRRNPLLWLLVLLMLVVIGILVTTQCDGLIPEETSARARAFFETPIASVDIPQNTETPAPATTPKIRTEHTKANSRRTDNVRDLEALVHAGINAERVNIGASVLKWDDDLASVARAHSNDMTERKYFDHDTPEGLDPTDRLHKAGFRAKCEKQFRYGIAENLAIEIPSGRLEETANEAVRGWMGSPRHRQNLLNREYGLTGVGVSYGTWLGYKAAYLTQVFC